MVKKTLYERTTLPDNHVDDTFLDCLSSKGVFKYGVSKKIVNILHSVYLIFPFCVEPEPSIGFTSIATNRSLSAIINQITLVAILFSVFQRALSNGISLNEFFQINILGSGFASFLWIQLEPIHMCKEYSETAPLLCRILLMS